MLPSYRSICEREDKMDSSRKLNAESKDQTSVVSQPPPDYPPTCKIYTITLESYIIKCFLIDGNFWLCFPQVSKSVLKHYEWQMIKIACVFLRINPLDCSTQQLASLKAAGVIEGTEDSYTLINMADAERLCDFLMETGPVTLVKPSKEFVRVNHDCFGGCDGIYIPELDVEFRSRCIQCSMCEFLFSPPQFICHSHSPQSRSTDCSVDPLIFGDYIHMNVVDLQRNKIYPCRDKKYRSRHATTQTRSVTNLTKDYKSCSDITTKMSSKAFPFQPNPVSEVTRTSTLLSPSVTTLPTICASQRSYITIPGMSVYKSSRCVDEPSKLPAFSSPVTCSLDQSIDFLNTPSVVSSLFLSEHSSSVISKVSPSKQGLVDDVRKMFTDNLGTTTTMSSSYNPLSSTSISHLCSQGKSPITCMSGTSIPESNSAMSPQRASTGLSIPYSTSSSTSTNLSNLYTANPRSQAVLSRLSSVKSSLPIPKSIIRLKLSSADAAFARTSSAISGSSEFGSIQTTVGPELYYSQQSSGPLITRATASFSNLSPVLPQRAFTSCSSQRTGMSISDIDNSEKIDTFCSPFSMSKTTATLSSSRAASLGTIGCVSYRPIPEPSPMTVIHYMPTSKLASSVDKSGKPAVLSHSSEKETNLRSVLSSCTSQSSVSGVSSQFTTLPYASITEIYPIADVSKTISAASCKSSQSTPVPNACSVPVFKKPTLIDKPVKQLALQPATGMAILPHAEGVITATSTLSTHSPNLSSGLSCPATAFSSTTPPVSHGPRRTYSKIYTDPLSSTFTLKSLVMSRQPAASLIVRNTVTEKVPQSASSSEHAGSISSKNWGSDYTENLIKSPESSSSLTQQSSILEDYLRRAEAVNKGQRKHKGSDSSEDK